MSDHSDLTHDDGSKRANRTLWTVTVTLAILVLIDGAILVPESTPALGASGSAADVLATVVQVLQEHY